MPQKTILFFDIDDTLVKNRFGVQSLRDLLGEIEAASGKTTQELMRELFIENAGRQKNDPDNLLTMDWGDMVQQLAEKYEVELSTDVDSLWVSRANAAEVEVFDNAPQVLQSLKSDHRKLIIATKGLMKYQKPLMDIVGLTGYFADFLTPDSTGYLKTSPDFFKKYRDEDALFIQIGDHYYDDVICTKRNGFYSILRAPLDALQAYDPFERPQVLEQHFSKIESYPDEGSDVRPDAVVISLEEVPEVVKAIEAMNDKE